MNTYNYYCINDSCDGGDFQLQAVSDSQRKFCPHCTEKLKYLGQATNIVHKGTQEANNKSK